MTNLIRLPPTTTMSAEQALQSALVDAESKHLADVLIIGYDEDGSLYIRSSRTFQYPVFSGKSATQRASKIKHLRRPAGPRKKEE